MKISLRRRRIGFVRVMLIILAILTPFFAFEMKVKPTIKSVAKIKSKLETQKIINDAILNEIEENSEEYNDLVKYKENSEGDIVAVITNSVVINQLKANIIDKIIYQLSNREKSTFKVPLGTLTGSIWLSGHGPDVPIRIMPVGTISGKMLSSFDDAGINQTRHRIIFSIETEVNTIVSGTSIPTEVAYEFIISETILVGKIPESYTEIGVGSLFFSKDLKDTIDE